MVDPDTLLTTLYVMVDECCQSQLPPAIHPGPRASRSRSEVITLGLFAQWACFRGERAFSRYAPNTCARTFPGCPIGARSIACCAVTTRPSWRAFCTWETSWRGARGPMKP
jgi:hypothetical protein